MRFSQIDGLDVVTRIAGPIHHFLGIEFGRRSAGAPRMEMVDGEGNLRSESNEGSPPPESVRWEVVRGIEQANQRLGSALAARVVRYCVDDPAVAGVYEMLAEALAERVVQNSASRDEKTVPIREPDSVGEPST